MTGTEYTYLHEGDKCILTEDVGEWRKGNVIEMIYRDRFEDRVYFKNACITINDKPSYGSLQVKACLRALSLYKKFDEPSVTKTAFEHKFNIGDTVWRMNENKPEPYKIWRIEYIEDEKGKGHWSYICNDGLALDDNCKIYRSKDELLNSLR